MGFFDSTESNVLEDNFKKSKQWCKDIRDILKIKTSWHKKDVKGDEYNTLKVLTNKVVKRLEKLKGNGAYKALVQEFVESTTMLKNAKGSNNKGLAISLLDKLTILDLKIDVVENKKAPEDVERTRAKVTERDNLEFQRMLQSAKETEAYLKTLGHEGHLFVGVVSNHIGFAQSQFENQKTQEALLTIGKVQDVRVEQEQRYQSYLKYMRRMEEAEDKQERFRFLTPESLKDRTGLTALSDLIAKAKKLADEKPQDYRAAYELLKKGMATAYDNVKKSLTGPEKESFASLAKSQQEFEKLHDELLGKLNILKASRAINDGIDHLDKATQLLQEAKQKVALATSSQGIEWVSSESLAKVEEQILLAEQSKNSNKEDSKANLEAMAKYLKKLHKAESALESLNALFAVDDEKKQLKQLILNAQNQLSKVGDLVFGYVEAHEVISGYEQIVKSAREKSLKYATADVPEEVKSAVNSVQSRIDELVNELLLSEAEANFYRERLQALVKRSEQTTTLPTKENQRSESEKPGLLTQVVEIGNKLNARGQELRRDKDQALKELKNCDVESHKMVESGVAPVLLTDSFRLIVSAKDDIANCEFKSAIHNLEMATRFREEAQKQHSAHAEQWSGVSKKLSDYIAFAKTLIDWPPLMSSAHELRNESQQILQFFLSTGDYKTSLQMFEDSKLEGYHKRMKEEAAKSLPTSDDGLPDSEKLADITEHVRLKSAEIKDQVANIFNNPKFLEVRKQHPKTIDSIVIEFRKGIGKVHEKWNDYTRKHDSATNLIDAKANEIRLELKTLADRWLDPQEIAKLLVEAQDQPPAEVDLPVLIEKLILQFENQDYANQSRRTLEALKESLNTTKQQYEEFRKVLVKDLELEKSFKLQSIEQAERKLSDAENLLDSIQQRHKNFQGYQKKLQAELADIKLMIASGDLDMIKIAQQSLAATLGRIEDVHPDKRDKDAVRFSEVEKAWTELHKTLGEHNYVPIRMPDTHQKLLAQLKTAEVLARKSSPAEGLKLLQPLVEPVQAAREQAGKLNDEHERYKQQRRDFEKEIEKARKETGTYYSERVISLRDYVNSRLNDAEKLRHTENGLPEAFKLLDGLREMIREVMATPESQGGPEGKIRELDAKYYEEQLLIREMARQFEIEAKDFQGPYLKVVRQTIEKNAKDGGISQTESTDLLISVDSLAKQGDSALQLVKPYIASVQSVPHKTLGQDPGPDKAKAIKDFESARSVLNEGRRAAERLMRATATTNVLIAKNRKEVEKFWTSQVTQFAATIDDTVKQIDAFQQGHSDQAESCDAAKNILEKVKGQFSLTAFTAPLKVLTDIPRPPVEKRLAAREEALKTMRQYREAILHDPVLRKLTDKSNPLNQKQLLAAFGNLRVALKRIEIESLIGV